MRLDGQITEPTDNAPLSEALSVRREMSHRMRPAQPGINQFNQDTIPGDSSGDITQ